MLFNSNLLIIAPGYPPATGGAATYTNLLVNGLLEQGFSGKIVVLTEAYPGYPKKEVLWNGKLHILRLFPFRSQMLRSKKKIVRYLKYTYQNLQFFLLPIIVKQFQITHILIHSSLHNYLSLISIAVKLTEQTSAVKLIADVRDLYLPVSKFEELYIYDTIVCSSENVYNHLSQNKILQKKLCVIPIPLKITYPPTQLVKNTQAKFELTGKRYIFSANGVIKEKGIYLTLEVVKKLKASGENLILVVAGKNKDWNFECQEADESGLLKYIGIIPNDEVFALCKGAELVINLSTIESPSRYSLEAIAVGAKVLLPSGVPEFDRACPEYVKDSDNSEQLAQQILQIIKKENHHCNYDLKVHMPENVIPKYINLLN